MFICGSGSFGHEDEFDHEVNSPCRTPKRSKRSTSFCKVLSRESNSKNPFADRGLDKFYALLAELDDKKQKIYTQKGAEDISFVRFVYTNDDSDKVKPIVVKVKEKKPETNSKSLVVKRSFKRTQSDASEKTTNSPTYPKEESKNRRFQRCSGSFKLEDLKQPKFYAAGMVVMILVFLAIYGRSFAIMCTSIGWYLAPTVIGSGSDSKERKPKRKKESLKKTVAAPTSPKSVINGLSDDADDGDQRRKQFNRKKSW